MNRKGQLGEHALPLGLAAILLWLIAALAIRALPGAFESKWWTLVACLAMIPIAELTLLILGVAFGLERNKRLPAAAWLGLVVIACHSLTLLFWPSLYGSAETTVRHGASWLAWAAICPVANARFWAERA